MKPRKQIARMTKTVAGHVYERWLEEGMQSLEDFVAEAEHLAIDVLRDAGHDPDSLKRAELKGAPATAWNVLYTVRNFVRPMLADEATHETFFVAFGFVRSFDHLRQTSTLKPRAADVPDDKIREAIRLYPRSQKKQAQHAKLSVRQLQRRRDGLKSDTSS